MSIDKLGLPALPYRGPVLIWCKFSYYCSMSVEQVWRTGARPLVQISYILDAEWVQKHHPFLLYGGYFQFFPV